MPVPTGLHAPITNLQQGETITNAPEISLGDPGEGTPLPVDQDTLTERVQRPPKMESSVVEETIPDVTGLPDIGVASFGLKPRLEVVIGTDERVKIDETEKYPWRVIASLLITARDNTQWIGTGWFISARTLITAGHCVYIKGETPERNGWVKKIQVIPGRNGVTAPFGAVMSTEFWTVKGWGDQGLENYDYAAIILPVPFQQNIGHYGYGVFNDQALSNSIANVAGYPGDKPAGTLWYDSRKVKRVTTDKIYYEADTYGGQSGTVVYILDGEKRIGIAIHAYGDYTANSGTRISTPVFANLEAWKAK